MKLCIDGSWIDNPQKIEVLHPFDAAVVDTVPKADIGDVDCALAAAVHGAKAMARLTALERYEILRQVADKLAARAEEIAHTITLEEGKVLAESRYEVSRAVQTFTISAEEE
jgi:glyceraldehyde-3-phosphate dehydrogenase (NADP+)